MARKITEKDGRMVIALMLLHQVLTCGLTEKDGHDSTELRSPSAASIAV